MFGAIGRVAMRTGTEGAEGKLSHATYTFDINRFEINERIPNDDFPTDLPRISLLAKFSAAADASSGFFSW
jgi:hypothetical protein